MHYDLVGLMAVNVVGNWPDPSFRLDCMTGDSEHKTFFIILSSCSIISRNSALSWKI